MALMHEAMPVVVNPEITTLPEDWQARVFGEFDFVVTDLARAPSSMRAEAIALLNERRLEREVRFDAE